MVGSMHESDGEHDVGEAATGTRNWLLMGLMALLTVPGLYARWGGMHLEPAFEAAIFGVAIIGAAFLLSWAAEAAEMDISRGLAIAFLALIAVLPEYAVDMYFAWQAAHDPRYGPYALANMTGANRLLIGVGWGLVVVIFWLRTRQRELEIEESRSVDIVFLAVATIYAFLLPLKDTLSLIDTVFFVGLFALYMFIIARAGVEEPVLIGPARSIGSLPTGRRRIFLVGLFVFSAVAIFTAAEPFAEGLVQTGLEFGLDEFLLVQWLAPLASEAPEMIVAFLFTWRGRAFAGIGTLISSKVNQWTLLIGTLPLVYSISLGAPGGLHLDARQSEEILLTAAQSAFAVAIISNLRISVLEGLLLFVLFFIQLIFPNPLIRTWFSFLYIALALIIVVRDRHRIAAMVKTLPRTLRQKG